MGGYIKSLVGAKVATIGLQVASTLLNTAISMGLSLAISALVSAISSWINKEKEAREEAIENAKAAKEESNNLTELLNKYNQLSKEVQSNQGVKENLLEVQSDLLEALGIEASQIDSLIEKYGDLDSAINQVTLDSLRDAQGDLMTAVDAYEGDLIDIGKGYAHWYSILDRNILSGGQDSVQAFNILENAGVISSGSHGTGGGSLVLTGNDKTVEGILENYQKLKDAQEALNTAIDNGEVTMEEMAANPLYQAINKRLDELDESIGNYNTAVDDLNKNIAQQQILKSLSEQSSIPETQEEFDSFKQSMIDTAIASTKFVGSQDNIKDSIINVLSTMPEFEKFFEEIKVKSDTFNNETTISFTEQISQVQKLSEGLDQLDKIYADVYDKEDFDWSSILNNEDFKKEFGNMTNVTDEYKDAYDEFIQTVSNSPNDIESCQEAFNKLATAYIYNSGCLDNLTEETRASSIAMLEQMGITNAEEIVDNRLLALKSSLAAAQESLNIAKQNGLNSSIDLENATLSEIDALIQEYDQYGLDTEALYNYMCQKIQANNEVIATNGDITALQNLCTQLGVASGAIKKYANVKARISILSELEASENISQSYIDMTLSGLEAEAAQLEKEMQNAVVNYKPEANYNGAKKTKEAKKSSGSNKSSNNDKKETEKDYDWIETKISRIQRNISNLGKTVSATYKSWSARNNALLQEINAVNSEISTQQAAYNKYMQLANSVGLDEGYANLIRNGALDVSTVTDEALSDKIEKYKSFYEKAIQCSDAIIDLKNNLADLAKTRFD